jgi:putative copper resistance protein D
VTARRFSSAALGAMLILIATGLVNAYVFVGEVAALLGTRYGHLLLAKLSVLAIILILACMNRRTVPALAGEAEASRPAMRQLARFVTGEVPRLAMLVVVPAMAAAARAPRSATAPQLVYAVGLADACRPRVLMKPDRSGPWRRSLAAWHGGHPGGRRLCHRGQVGLALYPSPLTPTPHLPLPSVPTTATSSPRIALYGGLRAVSRPDGAGDGLAGLRLPHPPADLRAPHTRHHTAGDLYWWISEGIRDAGMPGLAGRLTEDQRWDLVNFVRALASAREARGLGPRVEPEATRIVAPDATFAVGPTPLRSLREYRGRKLVLLVLYALPGSRTRLAELADCTTPRAARRGSWPYPRGASGAIRLLGAPIVWFPVVTEGGLTSLQPIAYSRKRPTRDFSSTAGASAGHLRRRPRVARRPGALAQPANSTTGRRARGQWHVH